MRPDRRQDNARRGSVTNTERARVRQPAASRTARAGKDANFRRPEPRSNTSTRRFRPRSPAAAQTARVRGAYRHALQERPSAIP